MAFDKEAEDNEYEFKIELIFDSGKGGDFEIGPSAYIAMGSYSSDERKRPMVTSREMSFDALKGQVDYIKDCLDARLMDAKARFLAAGVDV